MYDTIKQNNKCYFKSMWSSVQKHVFDFVSNLNMDIQITTARKGVPRHVKPRNYMLKRNISTMCIIIVWKGKRKYEEMKII